MANTVSSTPYCTPEILYVVLSALGILSVLGKVSVITITIKVIFVLIWAWFLNFLCESGYSTVSWFLVLLPILFTILIIFIASEVMIYQLNNGNSNVDNISFLPTMPTK